MFSDAVIDVFSEIVVWYVDGKFHNDSVTSRVTTFSIQQFGFHARTLISQIYVHSTCLRPFPLKFLRNPFHSFRM